MSFLDLFLFLVVLHALQDLSSPTRGEPSTTGEFPKFLDLWIKKELKIKSSIILWSYFCKYLLVCTCMLSGVQSATITPNVAFKNFFLKTIWEFGFFEHKPPFLLAGPCNKPFLLHTPMFWFVWPHYVSGTRAWVQWQYFCHLSSWKKKMFQTLKEPKFSHLKRKRDSLVVWWLGLHASTKGHTDLIPDRGTEILQSAWSKKEDIWILILQKLTQICVHFMSLYQHPWACSKEPAYQCRRCKRRGFDPWVRAIPCRNTWQPTAVFLPVESHGQRNLVGYSPWGRKESDTTEAT